MPIADAARRIKVACEARASKDFLVIARTDARTALGLDEALRRGEAFLKAGADLLFIESPESETELAKIGQTFGRDHTTVMYADKKIRKEMAERRKIYDQVQELTARIKQRSKR